MERSPWFANRGQIVQTIIAAVACILAVARYLPEIKINAASVKTLWQWLFTTNGGLFVSASEIVLVWVLLKVGGRRVWKAHVENRYNWGHVALTIPVLIIATFTAVVMVPLVSIRLFSIFGL